jgi:Survival motor neuron (SMN) interacting protein 1 (SIP1)
MAPIFKRKTAIQSHSACFELTPTVIHDVPFDGNEYLLKVQKEAKETTLRTMIRPDTVTASPTVTAQPSHSPLKHDNQEWIDRLCADFKQLRTLLSSSRTACAVTPPSLAQVPSFELIASLPQQMCIEMLEEILETTVDCFWIYSLLPRLTLVDNDGISLLRQLARRIAELDYGKKGTIVIVIICYVFGQLDLVELI